MNVYLWSFLQKSTLCIIRKQHEETVDNKFYNFFSRNKIRDINYSLKWTFLTL